MQYSYELSAKASIHTRQVYFTLLSSIDRYSNRCWNPGGGGIYFEHYSCIAITKGATIGNNITLFQGTTIGKNFGGKKSGYPTIGNNVIVFAGAKVIGNVTVGNNVVVGANSLVISDIPDNCVVAGIPAKVISDNYKNAISKNEYVYHFNLKYE